MFMIDILILLGLILVSRHNTNAMDKSFVNKNARYLLYSSEDFSELTTSFVELLKTLAYSKENVSYFVRFHIDIAKIKLFKSYRKKFATLCNQELSLAIDDFLDNADLTLISDFKLLLDRLVDEVVDMCKGIVQKIDEIMDYTYKRIINYTLFPLFEKKCDVAISRALDMFGEKLLDIKMYKVEPSIDLKKILLSNNTYTNVLFERSALRLLYNYIKDDKDDDILLLLDNLNNQGFSVEFLINNLAYAFAIFLKEREAIERRHGNDLSKDHMARILMFINKKIMKSKYAFNSYTNLIDEYKNTYLLSEYLRGTLSRPTSILLLLHKGVKINARDLNGELPLLLAVAQNDIESVKLLVRNGADVNLAAKDGITPLMKSVLRRQENIAQYLLSQGVNPLLKDIYGNNAFALAQGDNNMEMLINQAQGVYLEKLVNSFKQLNNSLQFLVIT